MVRKVSLDTVYKTLVQQYNEEGNAVWARYNAFLLSEGLLAAALSAVWSSRNEPASPVLWIAISGALIASAWIVVTVRGMVSISDCKDTIDKFEKNHCINCIRTFRPNIMCKLCFNIAIFVPPVLTGGLFVNILFLRADLVFKVTFRCAAILVLILFLLVIIWSVGLYIWRSKKGSCTHSLQQEEKPPRKLCRLWKALKLCLCGTY